ncbi:MAG: OmpH family outer membrane protein [Bacteroidetes bacterium]|nr:OmpH family outer membrane protein [Bacteroidota bacterium]
MQYKKIIITVAILFVAVVITGLALIKPSNDVVYVNINKVFNDFQMKKELEAQLTSTQQSRKLILDSLEIQLRLMSSEIESGNTDEDLQHRYKSYGREYMLKSEKFQEDNQIQTSQYDQQIWSQMNQYIEDYRKAHNYKFILGANGEGVLMAADKEYDITDKIIEYVNERYNGTQ